MKFQTRVSAFWDKPLLCDLLDVHELICKRVSFSK